MTDETDWHEDDDFWKTMAPVMFSETMWERTEGDVDALVELVDVPAGAEVLDMACGPGRYALDFAERGYTVTGVDRTTAYLEEAEQRARRRGVEVEWVEADMRDFRGPEAFDLALNLYTSFGFFDREKNLRSLENLRASLRSGGELVVEVVGKEFIAKNFDPKTWEELEDGSLFLTRREVEGPWERMHNEWIRIEEDGTRHTFEMDHRLYSAVELRDLVEEAGFAEVEIYGGFDGSAYDASSRLIAVGEK